MYYHTGTLGDVAVFVPSTANVNEPLSESAAWTFVLEAATFLSERFGGATIQPVIGFWLEDMEIITEDTVIVYSFTSSVTSAQRDEILAFAKSLKAKMTQASVLVYIQNEPLFV